MVYGLPSWSDTPVDPHSAFTSLKNYPINGGLIDGPVYGNIYGTNDIVKIDPGTGKVAGRMDLTSLAGDAKSRNPGSLEMNGIAFDSVTNSMYVTGKLWANIYEIKVDQ